MIEETLRWQAPIAYLPLRYAVEDIDLGDVVIPQGDAILVSYAASGYDVHHCPGAPLARPFDRFPDLALAIAPSELQPVRSLLANGHTRLPVRRYLANS